MGGKAQAPPAPNYQPLADASKAASDKAFALQQQQFDWAKQAYADQLPLTKQVQQQQLDAAKQAQGFAAEQQKQYEDVYMPAQRTFAQEAADYASAPRQELEAGRAGAAVGQNFDAARNNATQQLESFGINPGATRFAALDLSTRTQQAAATAAAENQARLTTQATGLGLQQASLGLGEVVPGQVAGTANTGLAAGQGAVNTGLATTASGAQTMGTAPQYLGAGMQGIGMSGNILNQSYQNQLAGAQFNQNASSGWGTALGLIGGIGLKAAMASNGGGIGKTFNDLTTTPSFASGGAVGSSLRPAPDPSQHHPDDQKPFVDHHYYVLHAKGPSGGHLPVHHAIQQFFATGKHIGTFASPQDAADHVHLSECANPHCPHPAHQRQQYAKTMQEGGSVDEYGQASPGALSITPQQLTPSAASSAHPYHHQQLAEGGAVGFSSLIRKDHNFGGELHKASPTPTQFHGGQSSGGSSPRPEPRPSPSAPTRDRPEHRQATSHSEPRTEHRHTPAPRQPQQHAAPTPQHAPAHHAASDKQVTHRAPAADAFQRQRTVNEYNIYSPGGYDGTMLRYPNLMSDPYQHMLESQAYAYSIPTQYEEGGQVGGALPVNNLAMGGPPTPGGAIPMGASPTMGRRTDDVPAQLTAGEFVIPKDVAQYLGEAHLQKLIQKTRQQKQGVKAKPTMGPATGGPSGAPMQPNFVSRPGMGAPAVGGPPMQQRPMPGALPMGGR
jgi:hypothetical protein